MKNPSESPLIEEFKNRYPSCRRVAVEIVYVRRNMDELSSFQREECGLPTADLKPPTLKNIEAPQRAM